MNREPGQLPQGATGPSAAATWRTCAFTTIAVSALAATTLLVWQHTTPHLRGAGLGRADLRKAVLNNVDLAGANLVGGDFRGAQLRRANLTAANMAQSDFRGAVLERATLRGANLAGTNLSAADLRSTDLSNANLSSATLNGTDLRGANLQGANLQGADFVNAVYDGTTRWPVARLPGQDTPVAAAAKVGAGTGLSSMPLPQSLRSGIESTRISGGG